MIVVTPLPSTERHKATTWCPLRMQVWERSVREHRCLWSGWFVDDLQIKLGKGGHLGVAILVRPVVGAGSP